MLDLPQKYVYSLDGITKIMVGETYSKAFAVALAKFRSETEKRQDIERTKALQIEEV